MQEFVPFAAHRGFEVGRTLLPVSMEFRRTRGAEVHAFGIEWEKHGRPRFAVPFGTCPAEGLWVGGIRHPPDTMLPGWLPTAGHLQPRRGSRAWFRQDESWWRRLLGAPRRRPAAAVVAELMALFPELESYWADGVVGPHVRIMRS